jgi:hypothetical protein
MRQFPTRNKFSGAGDESKGGMTVTEYLGEMTDTQKRIKLSREDFEIMMKKTTTGRAHAILMDYLTTGESFESIYHLFMLNFDKRITPLEAKMQLNSFKATKSQNLAKVTTQISQLAVRANSILPEGDSRNHRPGLCTGLNESSAYCLKPLGIQHLSSFNGSEGKSRHLCRTDSEAGHLHGQY